MPRPSSPRSVHKTAWVVLGTMGAITYDGDTLTIPGCDGVTLYRDPNHKKTPTCCPDDMAKMEYNSAQDTVWVGGTNPFYQPVNHKVVYRHPYPDALPAGITALPNINNELVTSDHALVRVDLELPPHVVPPIGASPAVLPLSPEPSPAPQPSPAPPSPQPSPALPLPQPSPAPAPQPSPAPLGDGDGGGDTDTEPDMDDPPATPVVRTPKRRRVMSAPPASRAAAKALPERPPMAGTLFTNREWSTFLEGIARDAEEQRRRRARLDL